MNIFYTIFHLFLRFVLNCEIALDLRSPRAKVKAEGSREKRTTSYRQPGFVSGDFTIFERFRWDKPSLLMFFRFLTQIRAKTKSFFTCNLQAVFDRHDFHISGRACSKSLK